MERRNQLSGQDAVDHFVVRIGDERIQACDVALADSISIEQPMEQREPLFTRWSRAWPTAASRRRVQDGIASFDDVLAGKPEPQLIDQIEAHGPRPGLVPPGELAVWSAAPAPDRNGAGGCQRAPDDTGVAAHEDVELEVAFGRIRVAEQAPSTRQAPQQFLGRADCPTSMFAAARPISRRPAA